MRNLVVLFCIVVLVGCENKDINEGEEFRPRAVRDNFDNTHFTKVTVDGVEYLMTERDNNNPHEGFGFMAFRANKLMEKQDTIISYLKTMQYFQSKMYARMFNISEEEALQQYQESFEYYLLLEKADLLKLEQQDLINDTSVTAEENE